MSGTNPDLSLGGDGAEVAATPRPVEEIHVGSQVGDYQLVAVLGRGGMAVVYLARQVSLDRLVALKMIAAPKAADAPTQERFRREARAVAQLDHSGIVAVHNSGMLDGALFYTMDYVDGPDLAQVLRERRLPVQEAAELVQAIAEAIGYAHERGIIHRDLKPANVLIDSEGEPRVTDFGLAFEGVGGGMTLTGDLLGTPPYMAPEMLAGGARTATPAADVYSLGAMLFQILTGRTPFLGDSPSEILHLALHEQPPSLRLLNPAVPRDLQTVVLKCLEKTPERRYPNGQQLADDLGRFLADEPILAKPASTAVRVLRWSRRRPALATVMIALAIGAIGGICAAVAINSGRERALHAEADAREQLWRANLSHAQAARQTKQAGARAEALRAVADAARFRPSTELRSEAIAALALEDAVVQRSWEVPLSWEAAVAFHPSLTSYVVEPTPGELVRRSCSDNSEISRLAVPGNKIVGIPVFSADGRILAVRYADGVVRVWDFAGAKILFELAGRPAPLPLEVSNYGFDLTFRPDSSQLAVGGANGGFTLHALPGGEEQAHWASELVPSIVRFSPDNHRIAVVARLSKDVHLLDATTLTEQRLVKTAIPVSLAWSPSGEQLAVGTRDAHIQLIAPEAGEVIDSITTAEAGAIGYLAYNPTRPLLISSDGATALQFWNPATRRNLLSLNDVSNRPVITFDPGGTHFAGYDVMLHRATIVALEPSSVYQTTVPPRPARASISSGALDVSPDGRWLASSTSTSVQLRDARTGQTLQAIAGVPAKDMMTAQFSVDGRQLFVCSALNGLSAYPIEAAGEGVRLGAATVVDAEPGFEINGIAKDGRVLLISATTEGAKLVDPGNAKAAVRWPVPKIGSACFSSDGRLVITEAGELVAGAASVNVWETPPGQQPQLTTSFGDAVGGRVQCSRDGRWVLVTGEGKTELWHSASWTHGPALSAELQGETHHAQLSPDGETLVIEKNHELHLLATVTGKSLATFNAPANPTALCVNEVFSPDGSSLSLLWQYGSVQVWNVAAIHRELAALGLDWTTSQ